MKSVAEYPEFQGNPDNIQFLTKDEHLEAHKGSWQNPTNWYYDPRTKEFFEFGDKELIPCKIIELSDPFSEMLVSRPERTEKEKHSEDVRLPEKRGKPDGPKAEKMSVKVMEPKLTGGSVKSKGESVLVKTIESVGRFIVENPVESLEIAVSVFGIAAHAVSSIRGSVKNSSDSESSAAGSVKSEIAAKVADVVEKTNRTSPHEHYVPAHRQRYHTLNGIEMYVLEIEYCETMGHFSKQKIVLESVFFCDPREDKKESDRILCTKSGTSIKAFGRMANPMRCAYFLDFFGAFVL